MDRICITQAQSNREIKVPQYKHLLQISEILLLSLNPMKTYRLLNLKPPGLKPYQD